MKNKKIIIYVVAAVLVLGLGIFLGIMFSKGGDEDVNDDNTRLVENTSNNTDTSVKNSEGSSNSSATKQNDADGDGVDDNTEVKASDIGQPIMPGDKQAEEKFKQVIDVYSLISMVYLIVEQYVNFILTMIVQRMIMLRLQVIMKP